MGESMEGVQLKLRMRVPNADQNDAASQAQSWLKKVSSVASYRPNSLEILPVYKCGYEEPITEVQMTIYGWEKNESAADLAKKVLERCYFDAGRGMEKQMLVQIVYPPEAFYLQCKPVHKECRLVAFQLGNFINTGTFYSHYEKDENSSDGRVLREMRRPPHTRREGGFGGERRQQPGLYADFEHDRNTLKIRFAALQRYNGQDEWYIVTLMVRYESIRRIVVDPCSPTHRNKHLYLFLNYPPDVRRLNNKHRYDSDGSRWIFWHDKLRDDRNSLSALALKECPVLSLEFPGVDSDNVFDEVVGRLKTRAQVTVEFGSIFHVEVSLKNYIAPPSVDPECSAKLERLDSYKIKYLIEALLSRGAVVKDQLLLREKDRNDFVDFVCALGEENKTLTVTALERLLNCVDEKQNATLLHALHDIYLAVRDEGNRSNEMLMEEQLKEGYLRVRKVIVTPTRLLLLAPELLMGNRVLRQFDPQGDHALRVIFRDDNLSKMRKYQTGEHLVRDTIKSVMLNGLTIAGKKYLYLGSSNSQMRDNGCYFFTNDQPTKVHTIRKWMGEFDSGNIPKMMSRMGLYFTQARKCGALIKRADYQVEKDVTGGSDGAKHSYQFSDGVGRISLKKAREIAVDFSMGDHVPSCYQFRFLGFKGVLTVDPALDSRKQWWKKLLDEDPNAKVKLPPAIIFRDSQKKFQASKESIRTLEIVKFCAPTCLNLNRPMINILDQVSGMQGYEAHRRVTERIHELLGDHLDEMAMMLIDENKCAQTLADRLPYRFDVDLLTNKGIKLTVEPFFRSLTRAITRFSIKRQLAKEQIKVPSSMGRTVFGVMDETGQLQYGQVFVQYTAHMEATPGPRAKKYILKGKVMVTKNPCVVPGDIRLLEAIDVPELRHLVDVIVFPQHGVRPHPDEMAGSDLDGDEYSVLWDPNLMFDRNEPAMDYIAVKTRDEKIPPEEVDKKMTDFFLNYVLQDSIGSIANAHLVNSDLYGIKSEVCKSIADKCYHAVDFPKTGCAPLPLTFDWQDDIPPEKPERYPDFMDKLHEPCYISPRLIGQLYRRIKAVDDVFELTEKPTSQMKIVVDRDLIVDGWEEYAGVAQVERDKYGANIRALMETYGIMDEGQLISGAISTVRNRVNDREQEDFSFYTTDRLIEARCTTIFNQA
uniref:RNA-dependent RNA polymerase n=1 Tax=Plectus sambesii TaxID=2011161 RepID=A0A914X2Y9_9BILA